MDEIVWAVDPQHDTFDGLMDYISAYAEDFLRVADIRCRMDLPVTLPAARVEAELRYNLFLALKETLNNVVKHAHATEVWLRLRIEPKTFTLIVEDNGRGFPAAVSMARLAFARIASPRFRSGQSGETAGGRRRPLRNPQRARSRNAGGNDRGARSGDDIASCGDWPE